jgi:hypothetical protein
MELVKAKNWDLESIGLDVASYYRDDEDTVPYYYWGPRWRILVQEVQRRKSKQGMFWTWVKQRSGVEYLMIITVFGVVVAVVFGLAGIISAAKKG